MEEIRHQYELKLKGRDDGTKYSERDHDGPSGRQSYEAAEAEGSPLPRAALGLDFRFQLGSMYIPSVNLLLLEVLSVCVFCSQRIPLQTKNLLIIT